EVAPIQLAVIAKCEHPPVLLGGVGRLRHEHGLAGRVADAEVLRDRRARLDVVAAQQGTSRQARRPEIAELNGIGIAIRAAVAPLIDARELDGMVVQRYLRDDTARKVDLPAI